MKALIVGTDITGHELSVQAAFVSGGGIESEIYNSDLNQSVINYAKANDFDAIIHSYQIQSSDLTLANDNPDLMIFMPTHSDFTEQTQQMVITESSQDLQGGEYEFMDSSQSADSYSNGYITGQIFSIASQRNCTLAEARICANATKDVNGIIDVAAAVNYSGEIKLTQTGFAAERIRGLDSVFTSSKIVDATSYLIEIEGVEVLEVTDLVTNYTLPEMGIYRIRSRGKNGSLLSDWSEWEPIKYPALHFLILKYGISDYQNFKTSASKQLKTSDGKTFKVRK